MSDNGYFFKADTIEELAEKITAGHEFQRVPLSHLADTVATWNSYVDAGADPDFEREADAPMNRIATPPFYALSIMVIWHDSYGGLRVNGRQQVVDMQGQVIPGLYAGGEAVGGGSISMASARDTFTATSPVRMPPKNLRTDPGAGGDDGEPHATRVIVWDAPPTVERGKRFGIKLGVTCPSQCEPKGWAVDVRDHEGTRQVTATLSDAPWPGTATLYYAEVDLTAPDAEGLFSWEATAPGSGAEVPHAAGTARFGVRVVPPPECLVTVVAVDAERHTPVSGAKVVMHPYRAVTDERGVAEVRVPKGAYRLFVSGPNHVPFRQDGEMTTDVTIRAELALDVGLSDADIWS